MPTKAEGLTPDSTPDVVSAGISDCIGQMMNEHPDMKQEQAIAACYGMAEKAMGRPVKRKSTSVTGGQPTMM